MDSCGCIKCAFKQDACGITRGIEMGLSTGRIGLFLLATCLTWEAVFGAGSSPVESQKFAAPCFTRSELIAVKTSRSIIAEVALTLQLSAEDRTTNRFTTTLLQQAAENLRDGYNAVSSQKEVANLLNKALDRMAVDDVAKLHEIVLALVAIENTDEQCS
jgi:hypothetical protein